MTEGAFTVLALLVVAWAVTSRLLTGLYINGPLVFLVAGFALGNPDWGPLAVDLEASSVHLLAEVTLALLLFADASRVNVAKLRRDVAVPGPAPRDRPPALDPPGLAGCGVAPRRPHVGPGRLRRRDPGTDGRGAERPGDQRRSDPACGYAASSTWRAGSTTASSPRSSRSRSPWPRPSLGVGGIEHPGARARCWSWRWVSSSAGGRGRQRRGSCARVPTRMDRRRGGGGVATLAAALASFAARSPSTATGSSPPSSPGSPSAPAWPTRRVDAEDADVELPELVGRAAGTGGVVPLRRGPAPAALDHLGARRPGYALLSLTVVRMVPVALALSGTGPTGRTVAVRGLVRAPRAGVGGVRPAGGRGARRAASAVGSAVCAVVTLTVLLSVVLHGVSAAPLGEPLRSCAGSSGGLGRRATVTTLRGHERELSP